MRSPVKILVGIPTYRRPELLRACLESIARQTVDGATIGVFVADNDPVDRAGERIVEEMAPNYPFPLSCEVVLEPGISAARNAILAEAYRHQFLAMIDDDETASENWLANLVASMREHDADVVCGRVEYVVSPSIAASGFFSHGPGYSTNNLLVQMRALWCLNKPTFDPEFALTGGEDMEWLTYLRKRGLKIVRAEHAIVTEIVPPERQTLGYVLNRAFRSGSYYVRVARKYRDGEFEATLVKAAAVLALAPLMSPLLLSKRRLWLLSRWARSVGKFGALFGLRPIGYRVKAQHR